LLTWWLGFISFSSGTIVFGLLLLAGLAYWIIRRDPQAFWSWLRNHFADFLILELLYLNFFLLFLVFRMYNPDIIGTEKFMDLAFLNAISRAQQMPPYDPWLAGADSYISYYYLGYFLMALPQKLFQTPPAVGFNLALANLFALSGIAVYGLLAQLTRSRAAALLGWGGLFLVGNFAGFVQIFQGQPFREFNWWEPSRVIENTINEFPFFSFLLGDMHPHMLAVPFFLLALLFALHHLRHNSGLPQAAAPQERWTTLAWGLVIGALGFLNSWDLPTAAFIAALALFGLAYRQGMQGTRQDFLRYLAEYGVFFALVISLPFLPFYFHFTSQAKGIRFTAANTRLSDLVTVFGLYLFPVVSFLVVRYGRWFVAVLTPLPGSSHAPSHTSPNCPYCGATLRKGKKICGQCGYRLEGAQGEAAKMPGVPALPQRVRQLFLFIMHPMKFIQQSPLDLRTLGWVGAGALWLALAALKSPYLAIVSGLLLMTVPLLLAREENPDLTMICIFALTGFLLILGCDLFHIDDTFDKPLERMNTVFKLFYQAWYLLGIAGVAGSAWLLSEGMKKIEFKIAWMGTAAVLLLLALVYPIAAIPVKTNAFRNVPTLDGSWHLQQKYAADRAAIFWLREHARGNPVVLEATGGQYTDFARVSTFSGLPTVLGWAGHELQWRGNYDEPGKRIPVIDEIYNTMDSDRAEALLRAYNVEYVFIGTLEREKHQASGLAKFGNFMERVYSHPGGVEIFRRRAS
jgi:uncharacterized membrane protein